jgi:hypothetical protein
MFSFALWSSGPALEVLLLLRGARGAFLNKYRVFYSYVACVLVRDTLLIGIHHFRPEIYAASYWSSEFLTLLIGCGVVWEVYNIAFSAYPGAGRVARDVLVLLFVVVGARVLVEASSNPNWAIGRSTLQAELEFRIAQMALLVGLLLLFGYYEIPLGRNLKGIIYGYTLFVATSVANLSLRDHLGSSFQSVWAMLQPSCYLLVLFIWGVTLWSYAPIPNQVHRANLETDYREIVAKTRAKLRSARSRLLRDTRL